MKIFIAGATGYTGQAVVQEAISRGHVVLAHIRPSSSERLHLTQQFSAWGAQVIVCPWHAEDIFEVLQREQPDAIFALLGTTQKRAWAARQKGERSDYQSVDVALTLMLLEAAQRAVPHARFVYLSSLGVGPSARGSYLAARYQVEQALAQTKLPFTVLRPSFISGSDRHEFRIMERAGAIALDGALQCLASLGYSAPLRRWGSVTASRLAEYLLNICSDENSVGRFINIQELR